MVKYNIEEDKLNNAAAMLSVLSNPVRIDIINLLDNNDKLNVTEIHTKLKIEQANASHHLNLMKGKKLLISKKDGKKTYYSINGEMIDNIINFINK